MTNDTIGSSDRFRLRHTHLRLAAEALAQIFSGDKPADAVLRELFAHNRSAGSRDRATVSALVYGVLRNYFALRAALGESASALELCAAHALRQAPQDSLPRLEEIDAAAIAQRLAGLEDTLDDAARHNLPEWLWSSLVAQYGGEAGALADALNLEASVDLRVNTLKARPEEARQSLLEDGIEAGPIDGLPDALRLRKREALQRTRAFREGWIEPQDAGSQRLAAFVAAASGETVVDFCAGAGGKTLALGAHMRNRGVLHAFDVSRTRLALMQPRLLRSGLSIVRAQVLRSELDARLQPLHGVCDAVLVDAPCSSSGVLRRNPEGRLRTPPFATLRAQQRGILEAASRLVRPGGRLVYVTCSVLADENERVVEEFLGAHPAFRADATLALLPHRDGTDGFFGARMVRASS